jgi:hypothetical protein
MHAFTEIACTKLVLIHAAAASVDPAFATLADTNYTL